MAQRYQVTLIGGGYPVPAKEGKVFNTALLVSPRRPGTHALREGAFIRRQFA